MKFQQACLIFALVAGCLAINFVASQEDPAPQEAVSSPAPAAATGERQGLVLPKIFDFKRFKSLFNKKYASFAEELAREKIFLGRAFRAFLSFVSYKHFKADHYLKISEMSDWTESEHNAILNRRPLAGLKVTRIIDSDDSETPVATLEDIQAKLAEVADQPGLSEELHRSNLRRRRAAAENLLAPREHLSADEALFSQPKPVEEEHFDKIESNNPHYQVPELSSQGAESEEQYQTMDEAALNLITNLPGASYIGGLFSSASNYLFGSQPADSVQQKHLRSNLPNEVFVDHRKTGCFAAPKNQAQCGSCYIFSTTGLFEWQFCHEAGKKVAFSEQYPLDCGERVGMKACEGGMEYNVAEFYGKFGLEIRSSYPYRQTSDICPYNEFTSPRRMGYIRLNDEEGGMVGIKAQFVEKYLHYAPMVMGLGVPKDFSDYGHGVDPGYTCSEDRGHSMVLVGSGREDGHEYWLFRNSYGPSWGLDGYYKLNKKATNCLLDDGIGFYLRPKSGKLFDLKGNKYYDASKVGKRYKDVMHGKYIQHNPVNYVAPTNEYVDNFVTPPPSKYY